MQLHSSPGIPDGELPVHVNPGAQSGSPFGIINFGDDTNLNVESDEDADRLIRAAGRVKEMLARFGTPHAFTPGAGPYDRHCKVCGDLEKPGHPQSGAQPSCGAVAQHTGRACQLAAGHDGWHHSGNITWPEPGDDEAERSEPR